jgi:excisionase family DNA binding protein
VHSTDAPTQIAKISDEAQPATMGMPAGAWYAMPITNRGLESRGLSGVRTPGDAKRRLHHGEEVEVTGSDTAAGSNLMDIGGVAELLSVRVRYVRRLVAERRIPYIKLGHLLRFDRVQIDEWLERSRVDEALPMAARERRRAW